MNRRPELKAARACLSPADHAATAVCTVSAPRGFHYFYLKMSFFGNDKGVFFFKAWFFSIRL